MACAVQARRSIYTLALVCVAACSSSRGGGPGGGGGSSGAPADSGAHHPSREAGPIVTPVALPEGAPGIGFDDIRYASKLGRVLAPAGRSGNLDLVDPVTLDVVTIGGFTAVTAFTPGAHADGATSADEGSGVLVALDQNSTELRVVDAATRSIVAAVKTASSPDYVRWIEPVGEFWVTEPGASNIEIFAAKGSGAPVQVASISVAGGPEAIAVDNQRGRIYTNSFVGQTYAIDTAQRQIVETWKNGCGISLGLALDEERGFLFVACAAGSVIVLDVNQAGTKLGELAQGSGLDIISFSPTLHHLYIPGGTSGDLGIVAVSAAGAPSLLGTISTALGARGVVADDRGNAWVCDPVGGDLLKVEDRFAKTD